MLLDFLFQAKREPAECVIRIGGEEISDLYPFLTELTVQTSRSQAAQATLRFEARRFEDGSWPIQDDERLATWEPIEIDAVFGETVEEVMRGHIRQISPSYPSSAGTAQVTVQCQDESLQLDRNHRREAWGAEEPMSDKTILETILADYGLGLDPASAEGQASVSALQDQSDIQFLRRRARANGFELIFRAGQVYFGPMRLDETPQPVILVYAGPDTNCISLSIEDNAHQPEAVAFASAPETGAETVARTISPDQTLLGTGAAPGGGSGLPPFTWQLSREGLPDEGQLADMAQQRANELSMRVRATGELDGSLYGHVLLPGLPVDVDGTGNKYGGTFYVDQVQHRFDMRGYRQNFTLLRNAVGDNLEEGGNPLAGIL